MCFGYCWVFSDQQKRSMFFLCFHIIDWKFWKISEIFFCFLLWYTYDVNFEESGGGVRQTTLRWEGGRGKAKMWCYRMGWGWGVASVLHVQPLFFLLKKIRSAPWPDIMLSQTLMLLIRNLLLNLMLYSKSHSFIMPFHFLWAKSNNKTRGQFECDKTWLRFRFDFVC